MLSYLEWQRPGDLGRECVLAVGCRGPQGDHELKPWGEVAKVGSQEGAKGRTVVESGEKGQT